MCEYGKSSLFEEWRASEEDEKQKNKNQIEFIDGVKMHFMHACSCRAAAATEADE